MPLFTRTVTALVDVLRPPGVAEPPDAVARFVLDQHARMPDYFRLGVRLLTIAFALSWLQPFPRLTFDARARRVARWRNSRFGPCRTLIKFYESLAAFGWASMYEPAA